MFNDRQPYTILIVEDDDNDAFLLRRALKKCQVPNPVQWAKDGKEAVAYLAGEGRYGDRVAFPFPELIILDLKMPRMSGLDLLAWLRDHPEFRVIPTLVMSSSKHDSDVRQSYNLGASTYFVKPTTFDALATIVQAVHDYWALSTKPQPGNPAHEGSDLALHRQVAGSGKWPSR